MFRHLSIFLCLVLILASCEDNKSSKENSAASTQEVTEKTENSSEDKEGKNKNEKVATETKDYKNAEGPLIVQEDFIPFMTEYGEKNPEDKIRISTRFGDIDVQLFHDTPLHRANFIFMVKNDYFDETMFHRVAEGFVIQGGNSDNPSTNIKRHHIGDYLIPSEFEPGHRHVRGAFSAAKYSEQNVAKASSPYEFFIVQSERGAHHLDNDHTVFGRVISGMDVVDEINKVPTDSQEWPMKNIYIDVKIIE
jgi:peptidylprolyl isomerase